MRAEKRMIVIPALIMITLSMTGVAVTYWSDVIYVEGTINTGSLTLAFDQSEPPLCIEFHEEYPGGPLVPGELYGENVGHTVCSCQDVVMGTMEQGYKTLVVEIQNGYPYYMAHCVFVIRNIGAIPADICEFIVTDPKGELTWNPSLSALVDYEGTPVIHIWGTSPVGEQIDPGNKVKAEFDFHIAQDAEECHTYSFEIKIVYTQWGQTSAQVPPLTNINIVVDNDWENDEQVEADVGGNFTWGANAFAKIQDAIDNASPNDNILVYPGTYNENINIDKSLTVRSLDGAGATIINAQGASTGVLINGAETVATFEGFTVKNYNAVGIMAGALEAVAGVSSEEPPVEVHILNNIVKPAISCKNIQVENGTTGTVTGNEVDGSLGQGIWGVRVAGSSNVVVSSNYVHDCEDGILIVGYENYRDAPTENIHIENNSVKNNERGISVRAKSVGTVIRYNDVSNNVVGIESRAFDVSGWSEHITPSGTEVHHNNIVGNEYGVKSWVYLNNTGTVFAEQVDATLNWWGDNSGPSGVGPGTGDIISGNARYSPWLGSSAGTTPMTFHVDDTGTIQAAIDNALPNETVLVYPGTYNENINIDKSLTVRSAEGAGVTTINAQEVEFAVLISGAGTVATFEGFTVENYNIVGILAGVSSVPDEVHILNNIVKPGNNNNIQVMGGTTGTVIGNEVSGVFLESGDWAGSGIIVYKSSDVVISNNYVHNCEEGITIQGYESSDASAVNNIVENNLAENNGFGITVKGMTIGTIVRYNDVSNNDVGIKSMAYDLSWENSTPSGTQVHYNNIVGNENYGVVSLVRFKGGTGNVLAEEVDATLNWWRTTVENEILEMIYGPVDYTLWLYEPYPTGW